MDRYLARTNIKAQQSDRPIDPATRADNLHSPPPGDPGPHGIFDGKAHARTFQLRLATHRRALGAAALGALAYPALRARSQRKP